MCRAFDELGALGGAEAMKRVYLIGQPVGHSISPAMHRAAFRALGLDYRYELLETSHDALGQAAARLRAEDCAGANVTLPHKEAIIPFLDELTESAGRIGAVNTIVNRRGRLIGENTDARGFRDDLAEAQVETHGARVVLLGAGGAARAVAFALNDAAQITICNRTPGRAERLARDLRHSSAEIEIAVNDASAIGQANLIVNATAVGMYPYIDASPLPGGIAIPPGSVVYDVIYRPTRTRLLEQAARAGARGINGLGMLVHQGTVAFQLWTGRAAPLEVMWVAACHALG